jgi:hypothetical protein
MMERFETDYELLKRYGHSPAKAAEIILDAKRGDMFSRNWIARVSHILAQPKETPHAD